MSALSGFYLLGKILPLLPSLNGFRNIIYDHKLLPVSTSAFPRLSYSSRVASSHWLETFTLKVWTVFSWCRNNVHVLVDFTKRGSGWKSHVSFSSSSWLKMESASGMRWLSFTKTSCFSCDINDKSHTSFVRDLIAIMPGQKKTRHSCGGGKDTWILAFIHDWHCHSSRGEPTPLGSRDPTLMDPQFNG